MSMTLNMSTLPNDVTVVGNGKFDDVPVDGDVAESGSSSPPLSLI